MTTSRGARRRGSLRAASGFPAPVASYREVWQLWDHQLHLPRALRGVRLACAGVRVPHRPRAGHRGRSRRPLRRAP
eukprot:8807698-Alexandrium_andersonii.AAC.1